LGAKKKLAVAPVKLQFQFPSRANCLVIPVSAASHEKDELEPWCQERAAEIISAKGWKVDEGDKLKIAKAVSVGAQRAALVLERRAKGDFGPESPVAVEPHPSDAITVNKPRAQVTLDSLLDGWVAEKRPTDKTIYSWKKVLEHLGKFVGHNDAARLMRDDLLGWKAALLEAGLRTKTIRDSKIAPLRAVLQRGVENRKIAENPAARIVVDVRTKIGERIRGFTDNEAVLLLRQAAKEQDPVKLWVPLLCAYSGARLSEVCRLRAQDIFKNGDVWCMKFDPEAGSLKNQNAERAVPLHPAITEAGFLKFVTSAGSGPLFKGLTADRFGNRGGNGTKLIGRWARGLGITDERISPSHSWRHRFKTQSRLHRLMPDIANAITGRHPKTFADTYGEFPIEALYRKLCKIPKIEIE
jgi:integrase